MARNHTQRPEVPADKGWGWLAFEKAVGERHGCPQGMAKVSVESRR